MIKKKLKTIATKVAVKVLDKAIGKLEQQLDNGTNTVQVPNTTIKSKEPTIAGIKWTRNKQKKVLDLMEQIPQNNRKYH